MPILSQQEAERLLKGLSSGWEILDEGKKLVRDFELTDFRDAVIFINSVADISEANTHHPDIFLHDYKKVRIDLSTHKLGGLGENDFALAMKIEKLVA